MSETRFEIPSPASASASVRIIAVAILFGCIYYASSVVITLICSILIASVLDPGVRAMETYRVPRWLASLIMVLLMLAVTYLLIYGIYDRAQAFFEELPKLVERLKQITAHFQVTAHTLQQSTQTIMPASPEANMPTVRLQEESPWTHFLLRGIGSVYAFAVTVMFIPFLVFFMLTSKNQLWAASLNLFPIHRRQQAEDVIHAIARMLRQFVVGNLFVGLISAGLITPVFAIIHLQYALLMGPLAAILSLIPYIGVALGILPPLLVALMQYDTTGPFVIIGVSVTVVHFVAVNVLTPKLVGQRVNLNALSVTIAMMFWSWLWGGF
ncbi:MAG TPA: AI-2E family transporter, partial [Terriglobia bacterium]|nr:AI-2E family transporter [Terriglobia bacterium]